MLATPIDLEAALDATRTGDLWLFRGHTIADRAIQVSTNSPVNHVGMAVVLDDLPPLMWHAELGRSLPDLRSGTHPRGVEVQGRGAAPTGRAPAGRDLGEPDMGGGQRLFDFREFRTLFDRLREALGTTAGPEIAASAANVIEAEVHRSETPAESAAHGAKGRGGNMWSWAE